MKLPDVYGDWRIVLGVALLVLGAGNWIVGLGRTNLYAGIIAHAAATGPDQAYHTFDELNPGNGGAVLAPFTAEQRRLSYAAARMDFYHATFLTGQAMVIIGLLLTAAGFIAVIRRDTRRALRRLGAPPESG